MAGAVNDVAMMGEAKEYTVGDKTYSVELAFVDASSAKLIVNGEYTTSMAEGGTFKLKDGTQVGVRDIMYQGIQGGIQQVEFTLGAEKLTIEDNQQLKMNDESINDVICYIAEGNSGAKRTISSITLAWVPNDKIFMTSGTEAVFPGLKSLKISMGDLTAPKTEIINVENSGERTIQIRAPIKSGTASIPLLTTNATKTGYSKIGDENYNLVTSAGTELNFNRTIDRYFVASWASTTAAESYLLRLTTSANVPSSGINSTDIIDQVTGNTVCDDKKPLDTCTIGNVILTINAVNVGGDGWVNISAGSGVNFNKLYTNEGMLINLPVSGGPLLGPTKTYINLTANPTSWVMVVEEEDKSDNIGSGKDINVSLGIASSKAEVNGVVMDSTGIFAGSNSITAFDVGGSTTSSKYIAYVQSDLATKLTYDSKPDQNTLEIEYHGGETYGNVYVASSAASVSSVSGGSSANVVNMLDTDAETAMPATNLIVVGGPAVNKVAAKVLGLSYPTYGSALTGDNAIVADEAMVKLAANTYDATKLALVVFGWEAKDTTAAGKYLINNAGSTDLSGKSSVVLTTATGTGVVKK
jgi:hypothetical protein